MHWSADGAKVEEGLGIGLRRLEVSRTRRLPERFHQVSGVDAIVEHYAVSGQLRPPFPQGGVAATKTRLTSADSVAGTEEEPPFPKIPT